MKGHDFQPPVGVGVLKQISWDHLRVLAAANQLVKSAVNDIDRAHLLASSTKESRAWLHALSISALGFWLDNYSVRIAVRLCLDNLLCGPHQCSHCGEKVDVMGRQGPSFHWSMERHYEHAAVSHIIHHALTSICRCAGET